MSAMLHASSKRRGAADNAPEAGGRGNNKKPHLAIHRTFQLRQLTKADENTRINDEIHKTINLSPVEKALIDTLPVQRLGELKQLGPTVSVYPNATHTRKEHSAGVATLGGNLVKLIMDKQPKLGATSKDVLCIKVAGWCHDLGHGPFSHLYETWVRSRHPRYMAQHPELWPEYADCPGIPSDWEHEHTSLVMFHEALAELGLAVAYDKALWDEPLRQIGDGIDATSFRDFTGDETVWQHPTAIVTNRDAIFIMECILGHPLPELVCVHGPAWIGRPQPHHEWLYDVISNRHSGLDVDKRDYLERDKARTIGGGHGEMELHRLFDELRVAPAACPNPARCFSCQGRAGLSHYMICPVRKALGSTYEFFRWRNKFHKDVYQHLKVVRVGLMIMDIFSMADPFFRLGVMDKEWQTDLQAGKPAYKTLPLSRAMLYPRIYLNNTDGVLERIHQVGAVDSRLEPAMDLLKRLKNRKYYVVSGVINLRFKSDWEAKIWSKSCDEIEKELLEVHGRHDNPDGSYVILDAGDFLIDKLCMHHGQQDRNPVDSLRFLEDSKDLAQHKPEMLPEAIKARDEWHEDEPVTFVTKKIAVFSRVRNKASLVAHTFQAWYNELEQEGASAQTMAAAVAPDALPTLRILSMSQDYCHLDDSNEEASLMDDEDEDVPIRSERIHGATAAGGRSSIADMLAQPTPERKVAAKPSWAFDSQQRGKK